jgi:hypothetical protein
MGNYTPQQWGIFAGIRAHDASRLLRLEYLIGTKQATYIQRNSKENWEEGGMEDRNTIND